MSKTHSNATPTGSLLRDGESEVRAAGLFNQLLWQLGNAACSVNLILFSHEPTGSDGIFTCPSTQHPRFPRGFTLLLIEKEVTSIVTYIATI